MREFTQSFSEIIINILFFSPALISYGSRLGLNHIDGEPSTNDGYVYNPLKSNPPDIIGDGSIIKAVDGLQFHTRDAL